MRLVVAVSMLVGITSDAKRLTAADFGDVPGVVIAHSPAASGIYIGSPGIVILADGVYLAKHDEFGPNSTSDTAAVTRIYESTDRGQTWQEKKKLDGVFWATLFLHRGELYLIGTNRGGGDMIIRKSTDGGESWTTPRDRKTGRLRSDARYHCAPVPVVEHNGRLWRAMEDLEGPGKGFGPQFRTFMSSARADGDLLDADNWTFSNSLERDPRGLERRFNGWLEGNAVVTPQGKIVNVLRTTIREIAGKAAVVEISDDGKSASFNPTTGFIDLPGGTKKFTIRWDAVSGRYWSLVNPRLAPFGHISAGGVRNTLALASSGDLQNWELNCVLLYHPDPQKNGYQYVDWVFDGDDIVAVARTAHDDGQGGPHNFHDANFLTFHRVERFRELTMANSVPSPISPGPSDDNEHRGSPLRKSAPTLRHSRLVRARPALKEHAIATLRSMLP